MLRVKAWVGVTDWAWYEFLSNQPQLEEVNFWQPGGSRAFSAIAPGELFLFKLRRPRDVIAGGGFFAHSSLLPLSLAWESFGKGNGAASLAEMKALIDRYRSKQGSADPNVFAKFPWFEAAAVGQILDVRLAGPGHLHWPQLDVDLAVRSIEAPDEFPLVSRIQTKARPKRAARPAPKEAARDRARSRRS